MYLPAIVVTAVLIGTLVLLGVGGCGLIIADKKCTGLRQH
ncbi:MAG: hypothetical protein RL497_105 [Pseudomonadota bacterium]